jgi:hypothetical protein
MSKQITKSYLEYLGITEITPDGKVFTKKGERGQSLRSLPGKYSNNKGYLELNLHDPEKYKATPKDKRNSSSGKVHILVHKAVFAWFNSEVPYGFELHHKDGNRFNNHIDNLEALTPAEHRAKHRKLQGRPVKTYTSTKEIKCRLDIPRTWYESELKKLEASPITDSQRSAVYAMRAKLRYYDNHIEEATNQAEFKKDLAELSYWKKVFKENDNKQLWHECCTIEKLVKEKGIEAWPAVKHALDVVHEHFGGK